LLMNVVPRTGNMQVMSDRHRLVHNNVVLQYIGHVMRSYIFFEVVVVTLTVDVFLIWLRIRQKS
jgi:hypothetical protein